MDKRLTIIGGLAAAFLLAAPLAQAQEPPASVAQLLQRGQQAGAPSDLLKQVQQRASRQGLNASETAALMRPAVEMAEQGLPARHVLRKALEGMAKRVPARRVTSVLGQMQQHTGRASQLVDPWLQRPEVSRLVGAEDRPGASRQGRDMLVEDLSQSLMQEVPSQAVEVLLRALPAQVKRGRIPPAKLGTAFSIMADLPTVRSDPDATAQLITAAIEAGFDQQQLQRLPAAVQSAQQSQGGAEAAVARNVAAHIRRGTPASEVLSALFRGNVPGGGPPGRAGPPGQAGSPGEVGPPPGTGPPKGKGPPEGKGPPDGKGPPPDKGPPGGNG